MLSGPGPRPAGAGTQARDSVRRSPLAGSGRSERPGRRSPRPGPGLGPAAAPFAVRVTENRDAGIIQVSRRRPAPARGATDYHPSHRIMQWATLTQSSR